MNRGVHRVVWNAARGLRMVVAETARGMGKGAARATVGATAVLALLAAPAVQAQMVANPFAAASQRPQVLAAPNGVPLVNITTPSPAGVSVNQYQQFDVHAAGAILNNSRTVTQTQLGGLVQGNPWLATGPARLIVNQVSSAHPSRLNGYIEVAGQRAEVVIANPAGIQVNGAGFINASHVTLTTGVPQYGALGSLDAFLVQGGTIRVEGAGLDAGSTDYAAILGRALQVNAAIHANELKVVTGANEISADHSRITPTAGGGPAPTFALDVAALGGMYARKITLIGTQAGLGVRNAGRIGAGAGGLVVTAAGRLENTGTLEGQSVRLSSGSELDNRHGTIRQASAAALDIAAPTLSNTHGGWIGAEPIATGGTGAAAGTGGTGTPSGEAASTGPTPGATAGAGSTGATGVPAPAAPPEPGAITAAGALLNDGGRIYAGGPMALQSPNIVNTGGTLSVGSLALNQASFSNQGGTLNVSGAFSAQVDHFDNSAGTVRAGSLDIASAGELVNTGGTLTSEGDARLRAGGALHNDQGRIAAGGDLAIQAAGVHAGAGSVLAAGVRADGSLGTRGDLYITTTGLLAAHGTNLAAGSATLQGASVDLSGSQSAARDIAVTATQGHVTTSGATLSTPGTLAVAANASAGQALVNEAGTLSAGQLDLRAANIANTQGGEIIQTGTGASTIAVGGTLNNDGGRIASNGQDLSLSGAAITNHGGRIEHAGSGTLAIGGGSFQGTGGQITGNGALNVDLAGAFGQDGGSTYAEHIGVQAGSLSNRGASIVQGGTGATTITVTGAADNTGGTLASHGQLHIAAGSLANQAGAIRAGGNATLDAGTLNNDAGHITAAADLAATVAGAASNQGGTLAANGSTTLTAGSYDNNDGGTTAAVDGDLTVTTAGATTNAGGTMQAGGTTLLANAGLDNTRGRIFGGSIGVDTHGQQFGNAQGTLAATNAVDLQTGALVNDAGLIQSGGAMGIDTHGQSLGNANAAGHASGQGGITSAGTLTLAAGAVNNAGGFIGAKGALTADTQGLANTAGGLVLGQEAVSIHTNGGAYDNAGGQTQAVGELMLTGAGVDNTAGLLRSGGTTTVAVGGGTVLNAGTQGPDQGIEGQSVAIAAGVLNNAQGAIRANEDLTATVGGVADNTGGLMSAGGTLAIADPNAATPAAKQLEVINTGGTLVADQGVVVDAASFSGDGTLASGGDLSLAVTQDLVNHAEVIANGDLDYGTTGHLTNNGKLLAGQQLTVSGSTVTNAASGEMSATDTTVTAAGTLTNRGLIDSAGTTRIHAGVLNNIGTGRIYGDSVAIGAGQVNNDAETVGGVASAATIAARDSLDIGATEINNREHALIFSGGDMYIGGKLDADGYATGKGATLNNLSADIESLGDMAIAMGSINNLDVHLQIAKEKVSDDVHEIVTLDGKKWSPADTVGDPSTRLVYHTNEDGSISIVGTGWADWYTHLEGEKDVAIHVDPSCIVAGGNMSLDGHVVNRDSKIIAGGTITADSVDNQTTQGQQVVTVSGLIIGWNPNLPGEGPEAPLIVSPVTTTSTVAIGSAEYVQHVNATSGYAMGSAAIGSTGATGGGAAGVNAGSHAGIIIEVASNVPGVAAGTGSGAAAAGGSAPPVPMVVRTSTPATAIPAASLFSVHAGAGRYLIETDPRFANYRQWLGSDYLLDHLGVDPDHLLKRLGDGLVEQKLIREQIAQLTGYRYLDGYTSDEAQYTALMDAGATFARQYGLKVGVALTAEQMAQLTSDIVWLVEQTVTLPDGSTRQVLVPQVYVRVRPGDIDGHGALLSADATVIKGTGNLTNTGTLAGRTLVSINADTVNNLSGGRITGGTVGIDARTDINNIGGVIQADAAAVLTAGRDINIQSTTRTTSSGVNLDRVAGLYVSNPDGVLIASAGRDVNLAAAVLSSGGSASVGAGRNVNLGTVTESSTAVALGQGVAGIAAQSRDIGSVVQAAGNLRLAAGNDLNIRASGVQSADGALVATAGHDINLTAGQASSMVATATVSHGGNVMRKTSSSTFDASGQVDVLASSLAGNTVALVAGNDINAQAAQLYAEDAMSLSAGRDVNFTTAMQTDIELHASQERSSSTALSRQWAVASDAGGPIGGYGNRKNAGNSASASITNTAVGTQVSAGSLQVVSGRDTTLTGATVVADGDITMLAGRNLTIESAQNTELSTSSSAGSKSGFIGSWSAPGLGHVKQFGAEAVARTTQTPSQVASLTGDVTLVAGNEYRQTASSVLAAGQAGELAGGDVNILARNVTINEAYDTEQTVGVSRSGSTQLGGSASFMGVSTDTIRNGQSTIQAMGQTGDGRMQALGAVNLAMSGKQAYDAAQAIGSGGPYSYGVSVSLSRNEGQANSFGTSAQAVGSSVVGAGNVNIVATGGGRSSNIHAVGSTIAAGNTVNLSADNDITLEASRSTAISAGRNASHGANVGVTFGAGAQNGFSIQLGVQSGQGRDNQNEIGYTPTQVSGGRAVNIASGGDLNLIGATVEAPRVTADVGGDLNITTLQDVSVGQTRESSSGFGVSLCIPPICYGAVATVSASAAGARADGTFVSPNTQSGIRAGDGGFDVNVQGNTNLVGGVIESTQAAIDNNRNSFHTGGQLTMTDLQNVSQSSGSSYSVSASASLGQTTDPNASQQRQDWQRQQSQPGIKPGGAGVGSYGGNDQSSVTRSGISGIAGDQSVRTGDTTSAGTLVRDWNTQAIVQDVRAQAQITQQFNESAARQIGDYASQQTRRYESAQAAADAAQRVLADPNASAQDRAQAQSTLDSARQTMAAEQATYDHWREGGDYRVALHTAAGALSGGVAGALGAGSSAVLMPHIGDAIDAMGLLQPVAQALGAVTAAAIGATVGGAAGAASAYSVDLNNRQLHQSERERLMQEARRVAREQEGFDRLAPDQQARVEKYWYDQLAQAALARVDDNGQQQREAYLAAAGGALLHNPI